MSTWPSPAITLDLREFLWLAVLCACCHALLPGEFGAVHDHTGRRQLSLPCTELSLPRVELSQILPYVPLPLADFNLYPSVGINYNCKHQQPRVSSQTYWATVSCVVLGTGELCVWVLQTPDFPISVSTWTILLSAHFFLILAKAYLSTNTWMN